MRIKLTLLAMLLTSYSSASFSEPTAAAMPAASQPVKENLISQATYRDLTPGLSRKQVRAQLGAPLSDASEHADRWDYLLDTEISGKAARPLALFFSGDRLVRIEESSPRVAVPRPDASRKEAAPAPAQPSPTQLTDEINHTVQGWAEAWMARNATAFFSFYSDSFEPANGYSRAVWEQRRRDAFQRSRKIEVDLSDSAITLLDGSHAEVRFKQSFRSGAFHETAAKTLELVKIEGVWKIQAERSDAASAVPPSKAAATPTPAPSKPAPEVTPPKAVAVPVAGAVEAPAAPTTEQAIQTTLQEWIAAWEARDADKFLAFYEPGFKPDDGSPRASWEQRRRDYFHRVATIKVALSDLAVSVQDERHAQVRFTQDFRALAYREVSNKTLNLSKVGNDWKITEERSEKPAASSKAPTTPEAAPVKPAPAAEKVKPAEPAKPTPAAKPTEAAQPARASQPVKEAKPAEKPAPAKVAEEAAPAKVSEPVKPEVAEPIKAAPKVDVPAAAPPRTSLDTVNQWARAWSERDVEKYLSFYSDKFQPGGKLSLADWKTQRKERISRAKSIMVGVHVTSISMKDMSHASVDFIQDYQSDRHQDLTRKTLQLEKQGERWLITSERSSAK
ncbi:MAG: outer membrane protein assembly factor BamE [Nitrosomonadales bacterium]|nr:outer membrane protein assembly factor BamE [Nitrosomonadales bacterium]